MNSFSIDQTYDKLLPIVAAIDVTVTTQSVIDNLNGTYTMLCKYPKWLTAGRSVTILGVVYKVVSVDFGVNIVLKGPSLPTALTFDINRPNFKHGTVRVVSAELDKIKNGNDKYDLIWLKETITESYNFNNEEAISTEADCILNFLTPNNVSDWTQLDADKLGIKPMRALASEFIKALVMSTNVIGELNGVGSITNYKTFGSVDANGIAKNVFNDPLTGVQLRIIIPFLRDCECCINDGLDIRPAPGYVLDSNGNVIRILYSNETYTVIGGSGSNVTIVDQYGTIINTVVAPGSYPVTRLTTIRDTIDANASTIIDNLN